jgi:hypothetical protein
MTTAVGISETMCHPGRVTTRLGLAALLVALFAAGCGGGSGGSPEDEKFIVELELPLSPFADEPEVYGQVGLSPNGRNGTRVVIRLDEPHKSSMEAAIWRGGCSGGFRSDSADYELGKVKDGELTAEVDVPTRDIRMGYSLVVREPRKDDEEARSRRDRRDRDFDKGTCGDLSSAEPVD